MCLSQLNSKDVHNFVEYARCKNDAEYFVFNYCLTKDEHEKGKKALAKHFPQTEYLKFLINQYVNEDLIIVAKSRQMMITWIYSALLLWTLLFKDAQLIIVQCLKEDRADEHLRVKIFYMWANLPDWMKGQLYCTYKKNNIERWDKRREKVISRVLAVQQGENAVRQFTASVIFSDEMAMQDEAEQAYSASIPSIDGGGKYIGVSTPNYQNFFYRLWHNDCTEWEEVSRGLMVKHNKNGFSAIRLHYTADPRKDPLISPDWYDNNRPKYTDDAWEREHEINFHVQAGLKYFPEYRPDVHEDASLRPIEGFDLLRTWDFGYRVSACTVSQLNSHGEWCILAEFKGVDTDTRTFVVDTIDKLRALFPDFKQRSRSRKDETDYIDYCDVAGRQKSSKSDKTDIEIMNDLFIYPINQKQPKAAGFKIMRLHIKPTEPAKFKINPASCPELTEGFRGAFHFKKEVDGKMAEEEYAKDSDCIHFMDCLKYTAFLNPDLSRIITPTLREKKKKYEHMSMTEKIWHDYERTCKAQSAKEVKFRRLGDVTIGG